jgi:integrase
MSESRIADALLAAARVLLPPGYKIGVFDPAGRPVETADSSTQPDTTEIPTMRLAEQMLDELAELGRSHKHIRGLRNDLASFASRFPDLRKLRYEELIGFLRERSETVGGRRRDNIRDAIVQLSRYARRTGHLPESQLSVAEKIPRIKPAHDIVVWTPAEAKLLLENVSARWLPCVALGLFAGLRTSEIFRLDNSAFKWDLCDRDGQPAPVIAVTRKVARKIRVDRLVPIQPNLLTWLEPYRERVGPLYPGKFKTTENAYSFEMKRIRQATGLERRDNANRHSYGSYRLAVIRDVARLALELGNSPKKVRENYNNPRCEAEGLAYFALARPSFNNVIEMPLALEFAEGRGGRINSKKRRQI